LWGVGEKTAEKLLKAGLSTIGDIARLDEKSLCEVLGEHGASLHRLARGEDDRPVTPYSSPKSIGNEETFSEDTSDPELIHSTLLRLCDKVGGRLRARKLRASGLTLKFRDESFSTVTRSMTLDQPSDVTRDIYRYALELLGRTGWQSDRKVRLIGITAHRLIEDETGSEQQTELFPGASEQEKLHQAETAVDAIRKRFGTGAIRRGTSVKDPSERQT
jgi:DNA polymerase-4